MNYAELIAKALKGRSTYAMAKHLGVNQMTLGRYVSGERLPDFEIAWKLAEEAGVEPAEAFKTLADEQRNHKAKQFKLQMGFVQTDLLLSIATLGTWPLICIMSNDGQTIYIVYIDDTTPVFQSHHAAYVQ